MNTVIAMSCASYGISQITCPSVFSYFIHGVSTYKLKPIRKSVSVINKNKGQMQI